MPLVSFKDMMADAERGQYAVGYFESWNLESLQAVADAAEATRSPVILGFSGIYVPHPARVVHDRLGVYAALGLETCRQLSVPACLLFNESPHADWVLDAIRLGFNLVMFTDDRLGFDAHAEQVSRIVSRAHRAGAAVEGEVTPLSGVGGDLVRLPAAVSLTDPEQARAFVERTGVDALAVNVGQAHLHGRQQVRLNLSRLEELRASVSIPLVLHGATSVVQADLVEAIQVGVRKINVGSALKQSYFEGLRRACAGMGDAYNPYEVVGSGLENDVLAIGRVTMQKTVEGLMRVFGCAGRVE